jgi:hypothetical protein
MEARNSAMPCTTPLQPSQANHTIVLAKQVFLSCDHKPSLYNLLA